MNNSEIILLTEVSKLLNEINHPDSIRIGKEIIQFTNSDSSQINLILERLKKGEPWEYIRGWSEFKGFKIFVNSSTLIPRIETEQLVDIVNDELKSDSVQIVDVGTGSCAIAIALKKLNPSIRVVAIDISKEALEMTKKNCIENDVEIEIFQNDLLNNFEISIPTFVVANLPYIPHSEYLSLDASVKDYEPSSALDGGVDGLDYISKLINQCRANLSIKKIFLEIDPSQGDLIKNSFSEFKVSKYYDFNGLLRFLKLDR
jgi:release factor glutamine methyltransferase